MISHISPINSISSKYPNVCYQKTEHSVLPKNKTITNPYNVPAYNINFTGLSLSREYKKTSNYLAAKFLESHKQKYNVDGSVLSANNIEAAIKRLFNSNSIYLPFVMADASKVKWQNYIAQDVREYSVDKINDARISRLNTWKNFLENPTGAIQDNQYTSLTSEIQNDDCLKFVIWNAVNNDIKVNNRHIPVPFDINALEQTVSWLNSIEPANRKIQVQSIKDFLDMYTHKLKDELLMERPELITTHEYIPDANSYWVRVPSLRKDPKHRSENISALENLSNENWCTRSSVDKAEAALTDGDFYLFLRRDKESQIWQTIIGMTSSNGKIDQIQGANNDNLIPLKELDNIKSFIKEHKLACVSGYSDEGPKAMQQIMIAEKLRENDPVTNLTLSTAISKKNNYAILNILGFGVKTEYKPGANNSLVIENYNSDILMDTNKGIKIPLTLFGISEDNLLQDVSVIEKDMVLTGKWGSSITCFPANLRKVGGKIICSAEQYEKYKEDMMRVVDSPNKIIVKRSGK